MRLAERTTQRSPAMPRRTLSIERSTPSTPFSTERFCPVTEVARLWRLLLFSGSHPMITDGKLLTPQEIVHLLLDGVLRAEPEGH